ncbi:MAG: helix-turn-helix domain-containing protein [Lachnospiraceae bacterium]|jgi:DNA-binding Xre family transcriptional regulator
MRKPNNIQQIMDNRKITYRQLSKMTGISWSALHKIANFDRSPTQDTIIGARI